MKLSISTIKIICSLWHYPEEILEDKEYLNLTIKQIDITDINFSAEEKETAKEEIKELLETLNL